MHEKQPFVLDFCSKVEIIMQQDYARFSCVRKYALMHVHKRVRTRKDTPEATAKREETNIHE